MTSIFLNEELNTNIKIVKNLINVITPEYLGAEQNIGALNYLLDILIEKKRDINNLRTLNTIPSDITDIDAYSDAFGDKIILVENRIQALQNVDASVEVGGRRRRMTKRRRNKGSKGSKRRRR